MDVQDRKLQIQGNLRTLSKNEYISKRPELLEMVNDLEATIHNDCYKILVLGEFKRGKSTLVNALLGALCQMLGYSPYESSLAPIICMVGAILFAQK